jgi:hypothetical protein
MPAKAGIQRRLLVADCGLEKTKNNQQAAKSK